MLQAELKVLGGKHQGKTIPLNTKKFLVGREQDCHLRPNSDLVSRHHCVFAIDDYAVRLRDLGSTNGTLVNGTSLRGEVILKSGDRITIGKLEMEMVIRQVATKTGPKAAGEPVIDSATVETPIEIETPSEEIETSYEMPVFQAGAPAEAPSDTAIIGTPQQYIPPMGYPPGYPQMMPPGYPMAGGYMPPQYPQYAPGYGQPQGYGQPMGYPMGFPQMMPMQPGFPGAAVAAPPAPVQEAADAPSTDSMAVRLPDPADTGVKPAAPPQAAGAPAAKKEEKPSTSAADIIKQYMNRRT